jgi:hypothetical protein
MMLRVMAFVKMKKKMEKGDVGLWVDGTMGSATHQGPSVLDTQ